MIKYLEFLFGSNSGAVYWAGYFASNPLSFSGSSITLSNSGNNDVSLARYFSNGTLDWTVKAGGSSGELALGVSVDSNSGAVYLTGYFGSNQMSFSGSSITLSNSGGNDAFLARYFSNGTLNWAVKAGGTGNDYSYSVSVDSNSGAVYLTGYFDSNPLSFSGSSITLSNSGSYDASLVKFQTKETKCLYSPNSFRTMVQLFRSFIPDKNQNGKIKSRIETEIKNVGIETFPFSLQVSSHFVKNEQQQPQQDLSVSTIESDPSFQCNLESNGNNNQDDFVCQADFSSLNPNQSRKLVVKNP